MEVFTYPVLVAQNLVFGSIQNLFLPENFHVG